MYEAFYQLRTKPFSLVPDPDFLYWTGPHRMAFTMLEYGVLNRAGFTVVTGEVGAGKTTLIMHLLSQLPGDVTVGLVSNTQGDRGDLLTWIMMSLEQDFEGPTYAGLYKKFEEFLRQQHAHRRRTIVIIDEAQNLGARALEELRMMSNMNTSRLELLQIILSGQPELKLLLGRPELRQFAQRVSSDFHLNLIGPEEVPAYIDHRLAVAGATRQLFCREAIELIYGATKGTPRLINVLCDTALMYGFAKEAPIVTGEIVQSVIDDKRRYGVFPVEQPPVFFSHGRLYSPYVHPEASFPEITLDANANGSYARSVIRNCDEARAEIEGVTRVIAGEDALFEGVRYRIAAVQRGGRSSLIEGTIEADPHILSSLAEFGEAAIDLGSLGWFRFFVVDVPRGAITLTGLINTD
jgi:type II secretory pathway predicted ATPase ExeA